MLGRNEAATILFRLQEIGICSVEDTRPQFPFHRTSRCVPAGGGRLPLFKTSGITRHAGTRYQT